MIEAAHIACHYLHERGWQEAEIARGVGITIEQVRAWLKEPVPEV